MSETTVRSNEVLIEFGSKDPMNYPRPYPAGEGLPAWLSGMPASAQAPGVGVIPTIKAETGIVAGTSAGYIIPLAYDCRFSRDERGDVHFQSQGGMGSQNPGQYAGTWFEKMAIIKFWNPWVMKTPPGWCTLVLPAVNRFEIPFEPLSGVIETDTYYQEVFFPTLCLMRRGQSVELKKGTPLVQVIPVEREEWRARVGELNIAPSQAFWHSTGS